MHSHPIKAACFDIDGTLAMMDKDAGTYEALPGAADALAACRDTGRPVVAYTNGTFFPPAHYYPLLADAGLTFDDGHIITPAAVAAKYFVDQGYKRIVVLGGDGTRVPLQDAGIEVLPSTEMHKDVDAIFIGYTRDFGAVDLETLVKSVWAGAKPYTASNAPSVASSKGLILGVSGALSAAVTYATDVPVTVLGKPSTVGMDMVSSLTGVRAEETVIIGDDPKLEIIMARRAGALAVGVLTGLADTAKFQSFPDDQQANVILNGLTDLPSQPWFA